MLAVLLIGSLPLYQLQRMRQRVPLFSSGVARLTLVESSEDHHGEPVKRPLRERLQ